MSIPIDIDFNQTGEDADNYVADGVYRVKLMHISDPKFYKGFQGKEDVEKCIFRFEVTRDLNLDPESEEEQVDHTGRELVMFVPIRARGEKSWLYKITKALMGEEPTVLGKFDINDLVYKECRVTVATKASSDGNKVYSNITDLMPLRTKATVAAAAQTPTQDLHKPASRPAAKPAPAPAPKKPVVELDEIDFPDDIPA